MAARGAKQKRLRMIGRARVGLKVTFTPDGGKANTQRTSLTLVRRR